MRTIKRVLVFLLVLLAMTACLNGTAFAAGTAKAVKLNYEVEKIDSYIGYVKTPKKGTRLNLRVHPKKDARIIKKLPIGTEVTVIGISGKFLEVEVGTDRGFVQSQYVVRSNPLAVAPLHNYYPPMKPLAESRIVSVSPARRGGFVNMRAAPSRSEPVMKYLYEDDVLILLAIDRVWVQVMDPETQKVGYVMRTLIDGI
ncbi:MAG: SH3 domain-containing protein [Clostridia bacterium]|nr:SH3 domain-containing protein [Clostridia bacterium]